MLRTILVLVLAWETYAHALEVNSSRSIIISGPIDRNLDRVTNSMNTYAKQSKEPIDIIINSPGGSVITGFLFINHMNQVKAEGIKIRCFVPEIAASMAFQILLQCNEKYVLERSFLLWHRVRVMYGGMFGAPLTAPDAAYLARELQKLDTYILNELYQELRDVNRRSIRHHFEKETLHLGKDLASMTSSIKSRKYIKGLLNALTDTSIPKSGSPGMQAGKAPIFIYQTDKVGK